MIWIAASFCFATTYLLMPWQVSWARSVVKTVAILLLAGLAQLEGFTAIATALALSALGDLLLSRPGERAFMLGVASFAAAHGVYAKVFLSHSSGVLEAFQQPEAATLAIGLLALGAWQAVRLWERAGELRWPVLAYIVVILGMAFAALSSYVFLLPALLFVASDLLLAYDRFSPPANALGQALLPVAVWVLYWLAQVGFVLVAFGIAAL